MPLFWIPVPFILIGTFLTWRARNREEYRTVAVLQPLTTALTLGVIGLGLLAPNVHWGFTLWILAGLGLSFVGDIFNINMSRDEILYPALLVFLVAYFIYPLGILIYDGVHPEDLYVTPVLLLIYVVLMRYLLKGLDRRWRIPGLAYKLVMLFMASRGIGTLFGDFFSTTQAVLLAYGCSAMFVADSEYAVHRFKRPLKTIYGPILYPTAQLAIALSTCLFPAA